MMESPAADEPIVDADWWQRVSIYWLLVWPGMLATSAFNLVLLRLHLLKGDFVSLLMSATVFSLVQMCQIHRLLGKDFRHFRLEVIRNWTDRSRSLSLGEGASVWLWIAWVRIFYWLILLAVTNQHTVHPPHSVTPYTLANGVTFLWTPFEFLLVGPAAVGLAIRHYYRDFHLQVVGWAVTVKRLARSHA